MSLEHARRVASAALGYEVEWGAYEFEEAVDLVRNLRATALGYRAQTRVLDEEIAEREERQ